MPYDERLGVHPQAEGFTNHDQWDFRHTRTDQYPLLLHFPYFDLYRKQVVKQADLVLAMYLCGDAFTPEEKLRNFAYYDAITVRDSSLSASVQAILAAEVGALDLAYDYLGEAALIDLDDRERNTRDGLHLASLAGSWTVRSKRSMSPACSNCRPEISSVLSVSVNKRKPWSRSGSRAAGTSGCAGIEATLSVSSAPSLSLMGIPRVAASIRRAAPPMSVNGT
jgi:hypothetical protein